jgi:hypothetical protein
MSDYITDEMLLRYQPDPKPEPRVRDKNVLRRFHELSAGDDCIGCGHGRGLQAHHILSRARGGDDVLPNLVALCGGCHAAYHGRPYRAYGVRIDSGFVRSAIGRYIRSGAGDDAWAYLERKLGTEPAEAFLEDLG